jgi:hypothetical protein
VSSGTANSKLNPTACIVKEVSVALPRWTRLSPMFSSVLNMSIILRNGPVKHTDTQTKQFAPAPTKEFLCGNERPRSSKASNT